MDTILFTSQILVMGYEVLRQELLYAFQESNSRRHRLRVLLGVAESGWKVPFLRPIPAELRVVTAFNGHILGLGWQ